MSNNSISSIRSALATMLGEVDELEYVSVGRTEEFSGYPACRFYLVGTQDALRDNMPSNERTYQFAIEIFQEMVNKTVADAEADFQDAIDAVLDKLNSGWTLSGNVDIAVIETGTISVTEGPSGVRLGISIVLSAKTLVS